MADIVVDLLELVPQLVDAVGGGLRYGVGDFKPASPTKALAVDFAIIRHALLAKDCSADAADAVILRLIDKLKHKITLGPLDVAAAFAGLFAADGSWARGVVAAIFPMVTGGVLKVEPCGELQKIVAKVEMLFAYDAFILAGTVTNLLSPMPVVDVSALWEERGQMEEDLHHAAPNLSTDQLGLTFRGQTQIRLPLRRRIVKRVFDTVAALLLLILVSPVYIGLAVLLSFEEGPVHYSQKRLGRRGRVFRCHKFRTMVPDAEQRLAALLANDPAARAEWDQFEKLQSDPRITAIGAFLRRTSLDELPQLWNVLKGEMSLVGPRPMAVHEKARWGRQFRYYAAQTPGVTGVWQLYFRSGSDYNARLVTTRYYFRRWSPAIDLRLLIETVKVPFLRDSAY